MKSLSGRIFVTFFHLSSVVIFATYTGNLVAYLTISKVTLPINSLHELIQSDYRALVYSGTAVNDLLQVRFI